MYNEKSPTGQGQAGQAVTEQNKDSNILQQKQINPALAEIQKIEAEKASTQAAPISENMTESATLQADPIKISPRTYAYGIWQFVINKQSQIAEIESINRDGILSLIASKGYAKRYGKNDNSFQYIHELENIIQAVEISQIRDSITGIINECKEIYFEHNGLTFQATPEKQRETFLRNSQSIFNDSILGHLPNHSKPLLHDDDGEMYFPFKNCFVMVTPDSIELKDYKELRGKCIWKDHLINKDFHQEDPSRSQFAKFIENVCNKEDDRIKAFKSAVGYLLHNYRNPTKSRAVIAYDEIITDRNKPEGRTGKGVFLQAIKQLRNVAQIDGKKLFENNKFSYQQATQRTQVICFDDVKPDFDFLTLNSNLSEGWTIEQKNKHPFTFEPTHSPKTYITSNTILKADGGTATGRQFIIEFSDHYSKLAKANTEPIVEEHGGVFFSSDWTPTEWNSFFSYMIDCAKFYLEYGLQFYQYKTVNENKLLQNTSYDFAQWIKTQSFKPKEEFNISDLFSDFKATYYGEESEFKLSTFSKWLNSFALTNNWQIERSRKTIESRKVTFGKMIEQA